MRSSKLTGSTGSDRMTRGSSPSAASRLGISFVLAALVVACIVVITGVTGPTEVALGSEVEYILDLQIPELRDVNLTPQPTNRTLWICYLAVDVPEGWTINSGNYEGVIGGVPVAGEGIVFEPPFAMVCDPSWPPVPQGYVRRWIHTETYDTSPFGTATAWVRFNVDGAPGEYTLAFRTQTEYDPQTHCSSTAFFPVTVSDSLIFTDSFESGDLSAWSSTVP